ncbi:hypothetical protein Bpfe_003061 [Biomphalaria pfeifferi]|uniref:Uncharacterized protein n=1 Tax=Biomphalaria pfeifferi TaxID=112525 RepID=A0AAD8C8J7_BIOPF|nr:hypothetical protein Bpfe_003061 [Biomphalaria pfeifferi]
MEKHPKILEGMPQNRGRTVKRQGKECHMIVEGLPPTMEKHPQVTGRNAARQRKDRQKTVEGMPQDSGRTYKRRDLQITI